MSNLYSGYTRNLWLSKDTKIGSLITYKGVRYEVLRQSCSFVKRSGLLYFCVIEYVTDRDIDEILLKE